MSAVVNPQFVDWVGIHSTRQVHDVIICAAVVAPEAFTSLFTLVFWDQSSGEIESLHLRGFERLLYSTI